MKEKEKKIGNVDNIFDATKELVAAKKEMGSTTKEFDESFIVAVENLKRIISSSPQIGYFKIMIDGVECITISGKLDYVKDYFADGAYGYCYGT